MDFALTEAQEDFVDAIRDFCDRECGTPGCLALVIRNVATSRELASI